MKKTHHLASFAAGLLLAGAQFACGQSGLINGNFENRLNGWSYSGVTAKSPAIESNYSACFGLNAWLSQNVAVAPGGSYTLTYRYAPGNATNQYHVGFKLNANGTAITASTSEYATTYPPSSISNRVWVYAWFVVPSGATNLSVTFTNESVNGSIKPLLDDINLRMVFPITILTQPQAQTVNIGETATFSVEAIGTPVLNYQWYREGEALVDATESSLTVTNCQQTDTGNYMVEISDPYGTMSAVAPLTVVGPFINGGFEAGMLGWNSTGGTWLQSPGMEGSNCVGFYIAEELSQTFTVTPGQTYMLAFDTAQCGDFPCSAFYVAVKEGETELPLTGYASDIQGPEGFKYHARCFYQFTAPAGASNVTVMFKDGSPDDGCSGYPVVDNVSVHTILLNSQPNSEYALAVGGSVSMSVTATGAGTLSYQWKKDGVSISGATASTLDLSNLQQTDSGLYTVEVSNAADAVETAPSVLMVAGPFANGDFEAGLEPWYGNSGVWLFDQPLAGNLSVSFSNYEDYVAQTFAVTPGTTYTLQYDFAEYAPGDPVGCQVWAEVKAGYTVLDLPLTSTSIVGPTNFWDHVQVTGQFTVPAGVTAVTLKFYNWSPMGFGGWPVIDSVSVQ